MPKKMQQHTALPCINYAVQNGMACTLLPTKSNQLYATGTNQACTTISHNITFYTIVQTK